MSDYDALIIGAGHNGLVCAAMLAKKGQRVLVLEALPQTGGLAQMRSFHAGFRAPIAHSAPAFSKRVADKLALKKYGLEFGSAQPTVGLSENGTHIRLLGDEVTGASPSDIAAYPDYRKKLRRYAKALDGVWHNTAPRLGTGLKDALVYAQNGLKIRLLGKEDMGEFLRVLTLPMRDLIDEVFETPELQGLLSWDGVIGSKLAPRSPNNAILPLLLKMNRPEGGDMLVPKGSMNALVKALSEAAMAAGVTIETGQSVKQILIEGKETGQRATGVELADGRLITADKVISSADPKTTFFKLLGPQYLEIEFSNRMKRLRTDGFVAKFHMALSKAPEITGISDLTGRFLIAPSFDAIEFAYDEAKYGTPSTHPVMEFTLPSLSDPTLAPPGQHVLSAHVMYAPYSEKTGWSEATRAQFETRILDTLQGYIPNLAEIRQAHELLTPVDIEREYHITGGHWHHGEMALEQMLMMRPTYQAAQYATPVPGLYLCGAGTHPGGGLLGIAGWNAARQILK